MSKLPVTPEIALRGLEARDIDVVLAIQSAAPEAAQWKRDSYEAIVNGGLNRLILAERSSTPLGFASYRVIEAEAELLNLAVAPDFRRQGIGARLLGEVVRVAVDFGASDIYLEVREGNNEALGLYEKFGFRLTNRRREYYRDPPADALTLHCSIGRGREASTHSSPLTAG